MQTLVEISRFTFSLKFSFFFSPPHWSLSLVASYTLTPRFTRNQQKHNFSHFISVMWFVSIYFMRCHSNCALAFLQYQYLSHLIPRAKGRAKMQTDWIGMSLEKGRARAGKRRRIRNHKYRTSARSPISQREIGLWRKVEMKADTNYIAERKWRKKSILFEWLVSLKWWCWCWAGWEKKNRH